MISLNSWQRNIFTILAKGDLENLIILKMKDGLFVKDSLVNLISKLVKK